MSKSSLNYTELAGLRIALAELQLYNDKDLADIILWVKNRIKELEEM